LIFIDLEVVKDFTHHEKPFKKTRKEKITDVNRLKPGDHVSFYKTDFYYAHHGIVGEVHTNYLRMIHYFNTLEHARTALSKGSIYIAAIIESEWSINLKSTSEDIYLHHYDNIPCFSNEETLQRAYSQLGRRGYSLIGNNCEHWSRWCRTGEHYSEQIYKFRGLVKEKSATLLIIDPTALLVKDVALVGVRTFGQFLSALGSGVILTAVESISAFIDIKKKKNERKKGSLSDIALKKYIVRRITSASTTVGLIVRRKKMNSNLFNRLSVEQLVLLLVPYLFQYRFLVQLLAVLLVVLVENLLVMYPVLLYRKFLKFMRK